MILVPGGPALSHTGQRSKRRLECPQPVPSPPLHFSLTLTECQVQRLPCRSQWRSRPPRSPGDCRGSGSFTSWLGCSELAGTGRGPGGSAGEAPFVYRKTLRLPSNQWAGKEGWEAASHFWAGFLAALTHCDLKQSLSFLFPPLRSPTGELWPHHTSPGITEMEPGWLSSAWGTQASVGLSIVWLAPG